VLDGDRRHVAVTATAEPPAPSTSWVFCPQFRETPGCPRPSPSSPGEVLPAGGFFLPAGMLCELTAVPPQGGHSSRCGTRRGHGLRRVFLFGECWHSAQLAGVTPVAGVVDVPAFAQLGSRIPPVRDDDFLGFLGSRLRGFTAVLRRRCVFRYLRRWCRLQCFTGFWGSVRYSSLL